MWACFRIGSHTMPGQWHSQPTPTLFSQGWLGVTCHPHFWQNDQGLLRATAGTGGWNGHQTRHLSSRNLLLWPASCPGFSTGETNHVLRWLVPAQNKGFECGRMFSNSGVLLLQKKVNEPFRRVKAEEIEVDQRLRDNSFEAKVSLVCLCLHGS